MWYSKLADTVHNRTNLVPKQEIMLKVKQNVNKDYS